MEKALITVNTDRLGKAIKLSIYRLDDGDLSKASVWTFNHAQEAINFVRRQERITKRRILIESTIA